MSDHDLKGYELLTAEESMSGTSHFGIKIFVRMSQRSITRDDYYEPAVYHSIEKMKEGLQLRTAKLDPEAPAKRAAQRAQFEGIFKAAGATAIHMRELPNGYCPRPCCHNKPWFKVTSEIGPVTIGWRKRVISIDWSESDVPDYATLLFKDEETTREKQLIHAWSEVKATEYIRRLREAKK